MEFILNLIVQNLDTIITGGIGLLLAGVFGMKWKQLKKALVEVNEAFKAVSDALEDDKVTDAELKNIVKEFKEAYAQIKILIKLFKKKDK